MGGGGQEDTSDGKKERKEGKEESECGKSREREREIKVVGKEWIRLFP